MPNRRTKTPRGKSTAAGGGDESAPDGRAALVVQLRHLIQQAAPDAIEQQKWKKPSNPAGVPVWYHEGILCHVVVLKGRVRLTLLYGAQLEDPKGLFNACLTGRGMRAIDIPEGAKLDAAGIKSLIRAGVKRNEAAARHRR